jgi:hypothetical protein
MERKLNFIPDVEPVLLTKTTDSLFACRLDEQTNTLPFAVSACVRFRRLARK